MKKIIGYFTSWDKNINIENLSYKYLTHINYSFLIPKEDGSIENFDIKQVENLIKYSHQNRVNVLISVGGWCFNEKKLDTIFEKICENDNRMDLFVNNLFEIVEKYNFDGIDVDWEFPMEKHIKNYEKLIIKIKEKLGDKKLSIAIPSGVYNNISINYVTDIVLNRVDWLNIMVYDNNLEKNHSSYEFAKNTLDYWLNVRKCDKEKIILGVPFYSRPSELPYNKLIKLDSNNYKNDEFKQEYYNGIETIKKKSMLAKECGGMMIWAINYDTTDDYSLLKVIYEYLNK